MTLDPIILPPRKVPIDWLNQCSRADFISICGGFFDHSPWIAEQAFTRRPFGSAEELHDEMCGIVQCSPRDAQLSLIRSHPDLVGRLAEENKLTPESTREQRSAGLVDLSADERQQFRNFNAGYWQKFGFPFVICARENKKEAILAAFPQRIVKDIEDEIQTALAEIEKIARLRLMDAVE